MTQSLTIDSLVPYLVGRGLIATQDLVDDGDFIVQDRTRRNRNFLVTARSGSLLVKQCGSAVDPESAATLAVEADVLRAVARDEILASLRWFSPKFVHFDSNESVLVVEQVQPATSLTKFHLSAGEIDFAVEAAVTAGRMLARFHKAMLVAYDAGALAPLPSTEPFAFDVPMFARVLSDARDPVAQQFAALLDEKGIYEDLEVARAAWNSTRGVIHGDVRWDNFLVTSGSAPADNMNLRLIDWELTRLGDPAWDVAAYLSEYLRLWSMSAAVLSDAPDSEAIAAFTFDDCHPSATGFLDAYCRTARLGVRARRALVRRIGTYLPYAIALVAFECTQRQSELPTAARLLLDAAAKAATDADAMTAIWFGIETKGHNNVG